MMQSNVTLLAINVYMPCDDRSTGTSHQLLAETLDEIQMVIVNTPCNCVMIGGDLNCDFSRNTSYVRTVRDFFKWPHMWP